MWQKFGNFSISMREVIITSILYGFEQKKGFNNLGLALGMVLKFYRSVAKGLKLKFSKFLGLILYVCRSYQGKTDRRALLTSPSWIGLIFDSSLFWKPPCLTALQIFHKFKQFYLPEMLTTPKKMKIIDSFCEDTFIKLFCNVND